MKILLFSLALLFSCAHISRANKIKGGGDGRVYPGGSQGYNKSECRKKGGTCEDSMCVICDVKPTYKLPVEREPFPQVPADNDKYTEYNAKGGKYYTCFWNAIGAYYPGSDRNNAIKDCNKSMVDYFGTKDNGSIIDSLNHKRALAHQSCSDRANVGFEGQFGFAQQDGWTDRC